MSSPTIALGDFQLTCVSGGTLWIDGGNMFGVRPEGDVGESQSAR